MRIGIKLTVFTIILTGITACQVPPVRYVTAPPQSIQIAESGQPLKIIVKDERTDKNPVEKEAVVEQFPEQRILLIMKERLSANNIKLSETDNKGELIVSIKTFRVYEEGANWKAHVELTFNNDLKTQNVETKIKLYNATGTRDAVKAMSQALSSALDDIKWNEFFPN